MCCSSKGRSVTADEFEGVDDSQGPVGKLELGDLLMKFMGEGPTSHLTRVDELPGETVELGRLVQGCLEVVCGVGSGIAVVNERSTQGSGYVAMLPFGPDAHQELDVV